MMVFTVHSQRRKKNTGEAIPQEITLGQIHCWSVVAEFHLLVNNAY